MSAKITRNFSMEQYWNKITEDWEPLLKFKGKTKADWAAWRKEAQPIARRSEAIPKDAVPAGSRRGLPRSLSLPRNDI